MSDGHWVDVHVVSYDDYDGSPLKINTRYIISCEVGPSPWSYDNNWRGKILTHIWVLPNRGLWIKETPEELGL